MHKQVSGWTVNFGPNFPENPFLELKTRKPPSPSILVNFRFGMTKVYSRIPPPHFGKLQIWDDQSLLRNTPPISENFRFGMTKVFSGIPPPHFRKLQIGMTKVYSGIPPPFRKTSDLGWPKFTPEYTPHFEKLQIWDDQSLLQNPPLPNENCQRVQVWEFQNAESYYMWRLYPTRITTRFDVPCGDLLALGLEGVKFLIH